ncbi:MAG: exopolysaccharide biosynthesis polyprenyl glycosylphosphotransferase [candidate division Zixibacteria bacterium]|nr:exopolysaccharide biosynthesis polyprenyl glycosylphosphotransferase [candidate division Zixibacteria bacterium]
MLKEKMLLLKRLHIVSDIILTIFAYFMADILAFFLVHGNLPTFYQITISTQNLLVIAGIWGFLILNQNSPYAYRTKGYRDMMKPVALLVLKGISGFLIWIFATKSTLPGRLFIFLFLAIDLTLLFALRIAVVNFLHIIRARGKNCQQIIVVGEGVIAKKIIDDIRDNPKWGIRIMGILDVEDYDQLWRYRDIPQIGRLEDLADIVQCNQVDYVVFAANRKYIDKLQDAVSLCEKMGVKACVLTDFFNTKFAGMEMSEFLFRPAIVYSTVKEDQSSNFVKAAFDRAGAFITLALAAPILGVISLLVKLTSNGPVFFSQERCGLNGRRFRLFKFRTMVENAEELKEKLKEKNEMDGPVFKISNDPRITRIGKFLRKTSLDELPQLFNIVRGDMSFVGPRPPLPDEVRHYDRWQRRKLSVKPGLTCLWQVGKRNGTTFEEWMKLDLEYIDNWSLWMDTKILLRTIPTVINGTGK